MGLRDVILVPISLVAALLGLVVGGSDPGRYFYQVLNFGRRTEYWINLFGNRRGKGTADEFINPFKERVFEEAEANPFLKKAGTSVNRSLDQVNDAVQKQLQNPPSNTDSKVDK